MRTITIKQHDTARALTDTLTIDGAAINLSGAAVVLVFQDDQGSAPVRRAASIVSAAAGTVSYQLIAADTAEAVTFTLEWDITFGDGSILTVPDNDYYRLIVKADLG